MKCARLAGLAVVLAVTLPLFSQHYEGQTILGAYGSAIKVLDQGGDNGMVSPVFGGKLGILLEPRLAITLNGGYGSSQEMDRSKTGITKHLKKLPGTTFKTTVIPVLADVQLNFRPDKKFNPYAAWGMGMLFWDLKDDGESVGDWQKQVLADFGLGAEVFLADAIGLDLSVHYQHILPEKHDFSGYNDVANGIVEARAGLNLYLGGKKDSDDDGIMDKDDKCPKQAEDIDGFEDQDGCPDPDNDNDGILDAKDQAPTQAEDLDGYQDTDGIPDLDNDGDGIPDARDKAPNDKEDFDGFNDEDGAPDTDNDADGVPDAADKCPNDPETVNGFEDKDGCPDVKPEIVLEVAAPIVLEGVNFQTGSASLTAEAKTVLDKVVKTLVDYPEIVLEVSGHTDNTGSRNTNLKLSQRRADAVKQYISSKGIVASRIEAKGVGPDKPVDSNDTADGRAKNRRIEFLRIK